jgi:nucleoside-diphosphate-sugar epimerase
MKILVIGGTGFMGPSTAAQLRQAGHSVTVFHRGKTNPPHGTEQIVTEQIITEQIIGDRQQLGEYRGAFARGQFDVVIDFILSSERQARMLMETFRGITRQVVALSSMDVYRAWGVFYGLEPGDLQAMPVDENSALRTGPAYPPAAFEKVRTIYPWVDDAYDLDKVPLERIILGDPELPGTVLRLPMVYGPGDYLHRFHSFLKRMDDGRPYILLADDVAAMHTPRGYVENVAAGIALAATFDRAAGQIYNLGEVECYSELEWAQKIAASTGWGGEFRVLPHDKTPPHLYWPGNTAQHLVVSSEKIRRELGYREPVAQEEAIRRTIEWERAHPPEAIGIPFNYEAEDAALTDMKASA